MRVAASNEDCIMISWSCTFIPRVEPLAVHQPFPAVSFARVYLDVSFSCSILTREENHAPVLQQGALSSILALTKHGNESIREACALLLFNFSCGSAVQVRYFLQELAQPPRR